MTEKKAITNGTGLEEDSFIQEILICQESVHTQEIQGKKTNKQTNTWPSWEFTVQRGDRHVRVC